MIASDYQKLLSGVVTLRDVRQWLEIQYGSATMQV